MASSRGGYDHNIRWAPKVSQGKIRHLYEKDAQRIIDEELIDDVAYALYARCESILKVTEAHFGKVQCPSCGNVITRRRTGEEEKIRCGKCSWTVLWGDFKRSYKQKQLFGGNAIGVFKEFYKSFPMARTPQTKMRWIDQLIHKFHFWLNQPSRPTAANLIEGKTSQTLAFLNELTYGTESSRGVKETRKSWRKAAKVFERRSQRLLDQFLRTAFRQS